MIKMYCDACGKEIPSSTNGGARLRTGNRELSFHLCYEHQEVVRKWVISLCASKPPREVNASLSLKEGPK